MTNRGLPATSTIAAPLHASPLLPALLLPTLLFSALVLAAGSALAQGGDTVTVEQRVLMAPDLSPAEARRRAIDAALAEAVRRVAGVRVASSVLRTREERAGVVEGSYSSAVWLDAAARAVDYRVQHEAWETRRAPDGEAQLYLRLQLRAVVAREVGTPDASFGVELSLNADRFAVRPGGVAAADEIIATVRTTAPAYLTLFAIADDSAQRLFPNEYLREIAVQGSAATQLPDPEWRARGLHLRPTLPAGRATRRELLLVVATRTAVPPPAATLSLLELQRWLVRIPLGTRALAVAHYDAHTTP